MQKRIINSIQFHPKYFIFSLILLAVLVIIAMFIHDQFIRPFVGDVLVVIWMYFSLRAFIKTSHLAAAHFILIFSYTVEIAQYFKLVEVLGLENIKLARIIIGSTFDWMDFVAYTTGWLIILVMQWYKTKRDA